MRIPSVESIFARMTALAQAHQALNLAQGLMWLPPDPALLREFASIAEERDFHQYSAPAGLLPLRQVIARLSERFFQVSYDPESEITVLTGATEGIFAAVQALTQPGDKALFIEPAYDSYLPAFQIGGIHAEAIPLHISPQGVFLDWAAVESRLSRHTRLLLLNFPHNPTGRLLHSEDVAALEELVQRFPQLLLIVDEAYELLQWDSERPEAIAPRSVRQSPILRERSVIVGSLGKLVGATGWRLGYTLAPPALTRQIRAVRQFLTFCAPTPLQAVVARYLSADVERATYFHAALLERRHLLVEALRIHTGLEVLSPEGGYFVLVRPPASSEKDQALAERLTREAGVAAIPLSPFYADGTDPGWLRLCFARPPEMLREAALRLGRLYPAGLSTAHPPE